MNLALSVYIYINLHIKIKTMSISFRICLHDQCKIEIVHLHRSEKVKGGIHDLTLLPQKSAD